MLPTIKLALAAMIEAFGTPTYAVGEPGEWVLEWQRGTSKCWLALCDGSVSVSSRLQSPDGGARFHGAFLIRGEMRGADVRAGYPTLPLAEALERASKHLGWE